MRKIVIGLLILTICSIVLGSIPNMNVGYSMKASFSDYSFGWYCSIDDLDANGEFQIYLGKPDSANYDSGRYVEKNHWGTFYGEWSPKYWGKDRHIISPLIVLNDTIESKYYFHYDGDEKYPCWKNTRYFYSKGSPLENRYVEIKDRLGRNMAIKYLEIEDSDHHVLFKKGLYDRNELKRCAIPENAKYIHLTGRDPDVADCYCEYEKDSGNLTFVVLPTPNDVQLVLLKDRIVLHPYDNSERDSNADYELFWCKCN